MRTTTAAYARAVPVLALLAATSPGAAAVAPGSAMASTYDVSSSDGVHVVYSTAGATPELIYESRDLTRTFRGDEIRTVPGGDLGTLVSVTIRMTVDTGSTSFTLVVPRVRLGASQDAADVEMIGITTRHRFSVVPRFNEGQLDEYGQVTLAGKARR